MHTEIPHIRFALLCACVIASSTLAAFEPGTKRTCETSADGQHFVCRDVAAAEPEAVAKSEAMAQTPVTPAEPAAVPSPASEVTPVQAMPAPSDSTPSSTSKLPNYLLSNPGSAVRPATSASAAAPAAEARKAPTPSAAERPEPAPTSASSETEVAPVPEAAAMQPVPAAPAAAKTSAATPAEPRKEKPPAIPAKPTASPALATRPTEPTPLRPEPAPAPAPSPAAASSPNPGSQSALSNASQFMTLPGNHYTIVLDSARNPSELDALIAALSDLSGKLYLLSLSMPDGRWYSLCWSDFDSLDAARAARADLPAGVPIASGWPRRISLLQSEIK